MIESKDIQKYQKFSLSKLIAKAQVKFNKFIRERDKGQKCISCGNKSELQAGHFYSAGHYSHMRFNEDNTHGQCKSCNYYKSGNLIEYRKNLIKKIGEERVKELDRLSENRSMKLNRFYVIEILQRY